MSPRIYAGGRRATAHCAVQRCRMRCTAVRMGIRHAIKQSPFQHRQSPSVKRAHLSECPVRKPSGPWSAAQAGDHHSSRPHLGAPAEILARQRTTPFGLEHLTSDMALTAPAPAHGQAGHPARTSRPHCICAALRPSSAIMSSGSGGPSSSSSHTTRPLRGRISFRTALSQSTDCTTTCRGLIGSSPSQPS
jgi:hypothetical protein